MSSSSKSELLVGLLSPKGTKNLGRPARICTTIVAPDCDSMAKKAERALALKTDLVELRIDHIRNPVQGEIVKTLGRFFSQAVLTIRPKRQGGRFRGKASERRELTLALAQFEPAYVDIDSGSLSSDRELQSSLKPERRIVSWHTLVSTPGKRKLEGVLAKSMHLGGTPKIVTFARGPDDNARILGLFDESDHRGLIAFCMGRLGVVSRIAGIAMSPIAYASLPGEPAAPGQLDVTSMRTLRSLFKGD